MTTNAANSRLQRGLELATAKHEVFRRIDEDIWLVPSATCSHHGYVVDASRLTCTCPDFEDGGTTCKHLCAVRYLNNEITLLDGTHLAPPPVTDGDEWLTTLDRGGAS